MFDNQEYREAFSQVRASQETYRKVMHMRKGKYTRPVRRTGLLVAAVIGAMALSITVLAAEPIHSWFADLFSRDTQEALTDRQIAYLDENAQELNDAQTENGWTVELKSTITDGSTAYIVLGITAPEDISLEQTLKDGVYQDWFSPGNWLDGVIRNSQAIASASGNYQYSIRSTMVEDGDGLSNTKNLVYTLTFEKFYANRETSIQSPFGSEIEWYIHVENIIRRYEDEAYRQELMAGKYAGQSNVMFTSEETNRLHQQEVLGEGTWDFSFRFDSSGDCVELLSAPISTKAWVWCKVGSGIGDYVHTMDTVTVSSIVLRPLSATVYYTCDGGANFTKEDTLRIYAVMGDGSQVELKDYGDGGVGFAQLKAVSPIVLEDVSCLILGDGTILNIPG